MSRKEKQEKMLHMVEQWRQSGVSQAQYAEEHNIHVLKLRYWIRQQNKKQNNFPAFIELSNFAGREIMLRYPNGVELSLPSQVSVEVLKSLVHF